MRSLRVAPVRQTALDLGPGIASAVSATSTAAEQGWWRLPEQVRVEVVTLLARLIAHGVLVQDPPVAGSAIPAPGGSACESAGSGAGERCE